MEMEIFRPDIRIIFKMVPMMLYLFFAIRTKSHMSNIPILNIKSMNFMGWIMRQIMLSSLGIPVRCRLSLSIGMKLY